MSYLNQSVKLNLWISVHDGATEVAMIAIDSPGLSAIFNCSTKQLLSYSAVEVVGKYPPGLFQWNAYFTWKMNQTFRLWPSWRWKW